MFSALDARLPALLINYLGLLEVRIPSVYHFIYTNVRLVVTKAVNILWYGEAKSMNWAAFKHIENIAG